MSIFPEAGSIREGRRTILAEAQKQLDDQLIQQSKSGTYALGDSTIQELIRSGANINAQDQDGKTPLMHAIQAKNQEVINALITSGADLEAQDKDGKTALMYAAMAGMNKTVAALVKKGADFQAEDNRQFSVIDYAIKSKNSETIQSLINKKNSKGRTELMERVREGSLDKVKSLIKAGADTNIQDEVGKSALMLAAEMGHTEIISRLLQAGAKPELKDVAGHTAIEYALRKRKGEQNKEIIKLLTFGIEDSGKTDLMLAAKIGDEKTIIALIDSGADLEAKDKDGETAIYYAKDEVLKEKLSKSLDIYKTAKTELRIEDVTQREHTLSSILDKLDNFDELNSLAPFGLTEDKIAKAKIKFLLEVNDSAGKTPLEKLRQDAHTLDIYNLRQLKVRIEKLYQKDSNKNRKSELKRIVNKILKLITPKSILQRKKIDKMITRLQTSPIQPRTPPATSIPKQKAGKGR